MNSKPFFAYRSFWKEHKTIKRFYDAGIRQFCIFPANTTNSLGEPYTQYPQNWLWFDAYDFSAVDEQIDNLLAVAPDAEILCTLDLNTPVWLVKQLNLSGSLSDSTLGLTDALTTERWVTETKKYIKAIIGHLESKYANRIKSYILACGMTDEWMDYSKGGELSGKLERYQDWCRKNQHAVPEFIPYFKQRFHAPHPLGLRDPAADHDALQYWKFISDLVAESIIDFTSFTREQIPADKQIGVFYGYILQLEEKRLVQCGHLGYEKVMASDSVDFLISPGSYNDREMGGGGGFMNPNGTIHLYQKDYLHEIDHATHSANWQVTEHVRLGWMVNWPDEKADIAGLRREFCRSLLHGTSLWWFDMWGGFFDSQKLVDEIGKFKLLWDKFANRDCEPAAEIAVIVDPESVLYIDDERDDTIANALFTALFKHCNRLGAPYKIFSFRDIPAIKDLKQYKMIFLPGLFEVTPGKKAILEKYILTENRTVVWSYGAALSDGCQWRTEPMKELTGAEFGAAGYRETKMKNYRSIYFSATAEMSPGLLRNYAQAAGVHLYTDFPAPVWATDHFLMVHVAESGSQTIRLKTPASVRELFDCKFTQSRCDEFTYHFDAPETVLFELKT